MAQSLTSINLLWVVGMSYSSTKAAWSRPVNTKQVAGSYTVETDDGVGIAAEIEGSVWNVDLRHVLVCVHVGYVYMCVFRVAGAFEDSRGLRGKRVQW